MEENECKNCFRTMFLRDGQDPTDYCDSCIRELLENSVKLLRQIYDSAPYGNLRGIWDFLKKHEGHV